MGDGLGEFAEELLVEGWSGAFDEFAFLGVGAVDFGGGPEASAVGGVDDLGGGREGGAVVAGTGFVAEFEFFDVEVEDEIGVEGLAVLGEGAGGEVGVLLAEAGDFFVFDGGGDGPFLEEDVGKVVG